VWGGHYSLNSEARVFRNWVIEEFEPPTDAVHRFGADWGFAIDPTVLVRCHVEGRKLYVDYEAWQVGCEIDKTPALFDTITGSRKWLIRADSARPETVSYMKRQGFRITAAIKGTGSIEDGIEFLRSFDIVVHPRCTKVIEELTLYAYKVDEHTGEILPVLEDKNNHTIDALRYALEELRRTGYKPAALPKKPPRDAWSKAFDGEEADGWKVA
jgi:phage terminase large subunit